MTIYDSLETPIGRLYIAGNGQGLSHIRFTTGKRGTEPEPDWTHEPDGLPEPKRQLLAYFDGELREFDLELSPRGTDFQLSVWNALAEIPYGGTVSYGELASRIGRPTASRAVGAANGANPLPIVLPCHRVIGHNGTLVGFGGGLDTKSRLLDAERRRVASQFELFDP